MISRSYGCPFHSRGQTSGDPFLNEMSFFARGLGSSRNFQWHRAVGFRRARERTDKQLDEFR